MPSYFPPSSTDPSPPYYAVILSSQLAVNDPAYASTAQRMVQAASQQPGFLGFEGAHGNDGFGIAVSYWQSLEAIAAWRADAEHGAAQERGRTHWYSRYTVRVARVERVVQMPTVGTTQRPAQAPAATPAATPTQTPA